MTRDGMYCRSLIRRGEIHGRCRKGPLVAERNSISEATSPAVPKAHTSALSKEEESGRHFLQEGSPSLTSLNAHWYQTGRRPKTRHRSSRLVCLVPAYHWRMAEVEFLGSPPAMGPPRHSPTVSPSTVQAGVCVYTLARSSRGSAVSTLCSSGQT